MILSSGGVKFYQSLVIAETTDQFFLSNFASIFMVLRHNSSVLFYRKVYILSTKGAGQSTNLVKLYISSPRPEIMHFDGILLSKSGTFSAKKAQRIISHETEEGYKF